ncbi:MAG: aldose 1-epimerase family protein, partial [Clostridia bacterium]|nr:aldose 1-epimerase family protein [Clostridia bacterium]
ANPCFRVPLEEGSRFEDTCLDFGENASPAEIILGEKYFDSGRREAFALRDGRYLDLKRELFAIDGHFFANGPKAVTLFSPTASHTVTVRFPDSPYFGIWTGATDEAALLCMEPWNGLPSPAGGGVEDLERKTDMFRLHPGQRAGMTVEIECG